MTNLELVLSIKDGNTELYGELYKQLYNLLRFYAKRYFTVADPEDIMQECFFALVEAVNHYEPAGGKFETYLGYCVHSVCGRYAERMNPLRFPSYRLGEIYKYKRTVNDFKIKYGKEPTDSELCNVLGISKTELSELQKDIKLQSVRSLNTPVENEDDEMELLEVISDPSNLIESKEKKILEEELCKVVNESLQELPTELSDVIRQQYFDNKSMRESAIENGITEGEVRSRRDKALRILRKPAYISKLRPFTDFEIYSRSLSKVGQATVLRTNTSVTERVALDDLQKQGFNVD